MTQILSVMPVRRAVRLVELFRAVKETMPAVFLRPVWIFDFGSLVVRTVRLKLGVRTLTHINLARMQWPVMLGDIPRVVLIDLFGFLLVRVAVANWDLGKSVRMILSMSFVVV